MEYIQVEIKSSVQQQKEILIALLSEKGYEGFEEEENFLRAFIPANVFDEIELRALLNATPYELSTISEKNWNQEWESNFQPVVIDKFCAIRARFHQPIKNVEHEIVITPKMSFGTGHHATTELMIRTMQEIDFAGKMVFDFGTGTGILSILAEKLGAEKIFAIDHDEWSYQNAIENFQNNDCSKIHISHTSVIPLVKFDVILANITRDVIVNNFQQVLEQLNAGGCLIVSGLLQPDESEIISLATQFKLKLSGKKELKSWICLRFQI